MNKRERKKNPLTVWSFPYRKRYYLTHPWKIVKDIYWNIRNFWHRGRFGFAYVDVWNFCDWYPRVGAEALRYLALHNHGYPGYSPWETPEKWHEYLNYLANRLERCANSMDICFGEERNEYKDEFDEIMRKTRQVKEDKDGNTIIAHIEFTPEEKELSKKYWARVDELRKVDEEYNIETYRWIGEDIGRLWD